MGELVDFGKLQAGNPNDRFELDIILDKGSSGQVWRATDMRDLKPVAIKIISKDYDDLISVLDETKFLARCKSHFITAYIGTWVTEDKLWLVMELANLGSMELITQVYNYHAQYSEAELRDICATTLLALKYLHKKNIIHRDVKGKNVLVTRRGELILADLGIAIEMKDKHALETEQIGSFHWMAPEIAAGLGYNTKIDIWATGIMLLELADGEPPHAEIPPEEVLEVIQKSPPPTFKDTTLYSKDLINFVALLLDKNMETRPTAASLVQHPFLESAVQKIVAQESTVLFNISFRVFDVIEDWRQDDFKQMLTTETDAYDELVVAEYQSNKEDKFVTAREAAKLKMERRLEAAKAKEVFDGDDTDDSTSDDDSDFTSDDSLGSDSDARGPTLSLKSKRGKMSAVINADDEEELQGWIPDDFTLASSQKGRKSFQSVEETESVQETRSLKERQRRRLKEAARKRDQLRREEKKERARYRASHGPLDMGKVKESPEEREKQRKARRERNKIANDLRFINKKKK